MNASIGLNAGDASPESSTPTGARGRKARGGFAITPQLLPDGECPLDIVDVPAAARDVRRYVLDGHERISWRCHVKDAYNIDFCVKVLIGSQEKIVVSPARVQTVDGYLDFGAEHDHLLKTTGTVSSSESNGDGEEMQPILVLDFDNNYSYFTSKRIDLHVSKKCGAPRSVAGYTDAIVKCQSGADLDRALRLYGRMSELGIHPALDSYKAVLSVCKSACNWEESLRLLDDMKKAGILPDAECYNMAIATCESCGQAQKALSIIDEMSEQQTTQEGTTCAVVQSDQYDADKLAWLKWALDEAQHQCPDGAAELRYHIEHARKSLEAYIAGVGS